MLLVWELLEVCKHPKKSPKKLEWCDFNCKERFFNCRERFLLRIGKKRPKNIKSS